MTEGNCKDASCLSTSGHYPPFHRLLRNKQKSCRCGDTDCLACICIYLLLTQHSFAALRHYIAGKLMAKVA
jgi:hypothetical protein